ncbi:glucose-6-phosphate isomerase [Steroidobacter denitrificans]|uniref:Glucose-6-phosphate isomerase n=1 Tax=Steroidobacter denitrificans TaxID=465721 RepID=A0A127FA34_STEDE|nr:glucose-6-phosphate isomerase [Steroidobacter denitrificans]AMN46419.1 glucose-6-phosphate isomerase [Steroidobacter denitrificans]
MSNPVQLPQWQRLATHAAEVRKRPLREAFATDPGRAARFSRQEHNLLLDFSRQLIDERTLELLLDLAQVRGLKPAIDAMFAGERINRSEHRAVLHVALRNRSDRPIQIDGQDVMPEVRACLAKMRDFVAGIHGGRIHGATGKAFTDVVNIGIGGSDLGIVMATEALADYRHRNLRLHCVSNVDGVQIGDVLHQVEPERTLFVVCSKTFTTLETLSNARIARQWIVDRLGEGAPARHFAAVSTNAKALDAFLIPPQNRFPMWDWVGGRYSVWSAVGLSVALALGMDQFELMLEGGHEMDQHFRTAPFQDNLPVLMGLLAVWNRNFLGMDSLAVLPYDQRLHRFPAYLQQLEMESNGKRATPDGGLVDYDTGAVIWGEPGSNAQHSFFQLLHQGTANVALDFLAPVNGSGAYPGQQTLALANCFAQAQAFAFGQTETDIRKDLQSRGLPDGQISQLMPQKLHPGNRPSSVLLFSRLGPKTLGRLIALYEHKVYTQSVIWGINAFDQWGVELGKKLAESLVPVIENPQTNTDPALGGLMTYIARWRV